jgi:hypothetical protein
MTGGGKRHTYHSLRFIGTACRESEFAQVLLRRRRYRVEAGLRSLWAWLAVGLGGRRPFIAPFYGYGRGGRIIIRDISDIGIDEAGGILDVCRGYVTAHNPWKLNCPSAPQRHAGLPARQQRSRTRRPRTNRSPPHLHTKKYIRAPPPTSPNPYAVYIYPHVLPRLTHRAPLLALTTKLRTYVCSCGRHVGD